MSQTVWSGSGSCCSFTKRSHSFNSGLYLQYRCFAEPKMSGAFSISPFLLSPHHSVTTVTQDHNCYSIVVLQNQRCLVQAHASRRWWLMRCSPMVRDLLTLSTLKMGWEENGCMHWMLDGCNPQAKGFSWLGSGWCCWWSCWPPIWADCQWENSPCWLLQWLRGPFWWQWSQLNLGNDLNVIGVSDRSSVFAEEKCLGKENMQSWPKSQQPGWKRSCRQMRRWELSSGDQTLSSQYHF